MNYIIDTDILIYFIKGSISIARQIAAIPSTNLYVTIMNHSELLYGAYYSTHKKHNLKNAQNFLKCFKILPYCEKSSLIFAECKANLKLKGTLVADMDLMIAGIALHHQMTLVTNNTKHFDRLKKLKLENWT